MNHIHAQGKLPAPGKVESVRNACSLVISGSAYFQPLARAARWHNRLRRAIGARAADLAPLDLLGGRLGAAACETAVTIIPSTASTSAGI